MKLFKVTHDGYNLASITYVCAKSFGEAPEEFSKLTDHNKDCIKSIELVQEKI